MRRQVLREFSKVAARSGLDAVVTVAEVHGIQVGVQDVLLRVALLEAYRNRRFPNFSRERPRRGQLLEPRELLRNRAAALDDAAASPIAPCRLDDTDGIQAVMRVVA